MANKSVKPSSGRRIFGDASWALLGQVGSGVVLLLGTRIITELVSPEVYGQVALLTGIVALGVGIFAYPFICAGMRLLPECLEPGKRSALHRVVRGLAARSSTVAVFFLAFGGAAYSQMTGLDPWLFGVAALLFLATVRREIGFQLLIGERRQREASLWQTSDGILRPLFAILLVWYWGPNAAWVLLGYAFASIASNTVWSFVHRPKRSKRIRHRSAVLGNLKRDVRAYAVPLIPMELLSWFSGLGDRYIVGYLMTAADVGIYAAAYTLTNEAFNRSAIVLLRTFQPVYFQHFSAGRKEQAFKIFWIWLSCVAAMGIAGVVALVVLKDWVAGLLLAGSYHSAAVLMPIIGAGCALQALGMVASQPLLAVKRTRPLLVGRLCGAIAAAVAIPLMIQKYGLIGAAMAAPVYFGIEAFVMAMLARPWRMMGAARREGLYPEPEATSC
ncbi:MULTISPECIES: lipopolysaccharide biosynthesis protein [Methylocaldum]|jgi:O-antigen/teichoic acid export membrane protein|uniref:lipopolysaccharide biosynthesis protein n=1 Tax=unclassified Methylocaldum TaxID=2622260 RepID=UPI00098B924D|nr:MULTISPECIES: lipopolysaccharide biosynthesis protein [unclassified Methylocaldum]MBP1148276.1 O-antigen/teichoic acid export membrane protein [Methylocaldum sp. RMAD-M]MVF22767.1 lipopolysaccharide biosynthesis protein [Methylocaldum sp. BRCS4]